MVNFLAGKAHYYNGSLIQSSAGNQRESYQSECIQLPLPGGFYHGSYSDIFDVCLPRLPNSVQTAAKLRYLEDKEVLMYQHVYQVGQGNLNAMKSSYNTYI